MHGMVNRALQGFLTATYGDEVWAEVRSQAALSCDDFGAMLSYPDAMTSACFHAAICARRSFVCCTKIMAPCWRISASGW